MSLLAPRLWSLNTIFHRKEQVILEEMIDSRSVAQNVPDEPGNFCHTTKKKKKMLPTTTRVMSKRMEMPS